MSLRKSANNSSTCACTVTSSAVVGSSANNSFGLHAIDIAIITRWRIPPDNWCGYLVRASSGSGRRTCERSSIDRFLASSFDMPSRLTSDSDICEPIRRTGLSAVIGSWKTMAIFVPQYSRTCSLSRVRRSVPSKMILPVRCTRLPRSRPIAARENTVLPEPDSPTMPTLSPAAMSSETPRTA